MHMSIYVNIRIVNSSEDELHSHPDLTVSVSSKTKRQNLEIMRKAQSASERAHHNTFVSCYGSRDVPVTLETILCV